jgi:hypothetical protein
MTNPGFMGQRAGQQASQSATNAARQQASQNYQAGLRHSLDAARRSGGYRRTRRFGLLGRLVSLVVTLVVLAVAAGIALLILSQAAPDVFAQLTSWL